MNDFSDDDHSDVQRSFHQNDKEVTHEELVDSSLESSHMDPSGSEAYSDEKDEQVH